MTTDDTARTTETTETLSGDLELIGSVGDATGVAHPGDTLVLHGERVSHAEAEKVRQLLLERIPGLADVLIVPFAVTAIYRPDPERTEPAEEAQP